MTNYSKQAYDLTQVIGYLVRNDALDSAQFLNEDSKNPANPILFMYQNDQVLFLGLALLQIGKTEPLLEEAKRNPKAVESLMRFAALEGNLFKMCLANKEPRAIGDVVRIITDVMPKHASSVIGGGLFSSRQVKFTLKDSSISHLKELYSALKEKGFGQYFKKDIEELIQDYADNFSGTLSLDRIKSPQEYEELFKEMREIFDGQDANELIKNVLQDVLLPKALLHSDFYDTGKDNEKQMAVLDVCFKEADKTGVDYKALLTDTDLRGTCLMHEVALRNNGDILETLLSKLSSSIGQEQTDQWLSSFLTNPRAVMNEKVTYDMQDVRSVVPHKSEEYEKIDLLCPFGLNKFFDVSDLRQLIDDCAVHIYEYLDQNKPESGYEKERAQRLRSFADDNGPVSEGPTVLGTAHGEMLEVLFRKVCQVCNFDLQQLADHYFTDVTKVLDTSDGNTAMHRNWVYSVMRGPPGSEDAVEESLSDFISRLDRGFGTEIALPLTKKLFAVKNANGNRPFDRVFRDGPDEQYGMYYYPKMVKELAKALGDDNKFQRYMDEVIVPNMPAAYGGNTADPDSAAAKYLDRLGPK